MLDEATVREVCEQFLGWDDWEHEEFWELCMAGNRLDERPKALGLMVNFITTRHEDMPQPCPRGCVCADHFSQRGGETTPNVT